MKTVKGGDQMRRAFNTSVEEEIANAFKDKCKQENIPMNKVLEMFMEGYINNQFTVEMKVNFKEEKRK